MTEDSHTQPPENSDAPRSLEEMTLSELLAHFIRSPRQTGESIWRYARQPRDNTSAEISPDNTLAVSTGQSRQISFELNHKLARFGLYLLAFFMAWIGSFILINTPSRSEEVTLRYGFPFLVSGFAIWILAEIIGDWDQVKSWWKEKDRRNRIKTLICLIPLLLIGLGLFSFLASFEQSGSDLGSSVLRGFVFISAGILVWIAVDIGFHFYQRSSNTTEQSVSGDDFSQRDWILYLQRRILILPASILSLITWLGTSNNTYDNLTFYCWIASIFLWAIALSSVDWNPLQSLRFWFGRIRNFHIREHWFVILSLAGIIILAALFRLHHLHSVPPEMTSDHVEKILDAYRVSNGDRDIFFANNGGREPFQMYALALFSQLPGLGMNHDTLQLLAVLEGLVTIPLMYWLGREVVGKRNKRLGILLGLLAAALLAVSYWHVSITRLSLRIILTPAVTALLLIYLSRALRRNNRADFIKAGLVLGLGVYTYQAVRMLPIAVALAILVIGIYFVAKSWNERKQFFINFLVLVTIAVVGFLPLGHYMTEYSADLNRRTLSRLCGDEIYQEQLEDGTIVQRTPSMSDCIPLIIENAPTLMSNIRNVLLMFNWKGDVAWINGVPNHPVFNPVTGALFIIGLAGWITYMVRYRDAAFWTVFLTLFVMLLPSALAIAYPNENPSATRTSGAIPSAFLIAAYPLAVMILASFGAFKRNIATIFSVLLCVIVLLSSFAYNWNLYFNDFVRSYTTSSLPYSEAGRILRGFAESDGGYENAFMIGFPFWWDHRAVGIEAGRPDWPNGIVNSDSLAILRFLYFASFRDDVYRFDPDKDILFFYAMGDEETSTSLNEWFPQGRETLYDSYQPEDDFLMYRVPALGQQGFNELINSYELP